MRVMTDRALNPRHRQFVDEYYLDPARNASAAYCRVYGPKTPKVARVAASRLMTDPRVKAECERREQDLRERAGLSAADVLQLCVQIATADPRDLVEYWRGPCRYCHGEGHQYQRTPLEYRTAWALYAKERRDDPMGLHFDHLGGLGFNRRARPHPACPECNGDGHGYEIVKDTRALSPQAARLYGGVKTTKDGIQVMMRNQDKMIELLAKTHGLLRDTEKNPDDMAAPPAATVVYESHDASVSK